MALAEDPDKLARWLPPHSRYEILGKIAAGGMATVYVGCLRGARGFERLVAIKRAHPHLLQDAVYRRMLVEEALLAAKLHHPNVVAVQDVEEHEGELLLVMDYVEGASLSDLAKLGRVPAGICLRVAVDVAHGLHAAHTCSEDGVSLGLIHRDVSPQNILVGIDGIARIADFGVAKSERDTGASLKTTTGTLKGKVAYMAPEYMRGETIDARADVFSLGTVIWEVLTGRRLFRAKTEVQTIQAVLACQVPVPSSVNSSLHPIVDDVVLKALELDVTKRWQSMEELSQALEGAARSVGSLAAHSEVAQVVRERSRDALASRREAIRARRRGAPSSKPSDMANYTEPSRTASLSLASVGADAVSSDATRGSALAVSVRPSRRRYTLPLVLLGTASAAVVVVLLLRPSQTEEPVSVPEVAAPAPAPSPEVVASGAPVPAPLPTAHDDAAAPAVPAPPAATAADPAPAPRPAASPKTPPKPTSAPEVPAKPTTKPKVAPPNPYD